MSYNCGLENGISAEKSESDDETKKVRQVYDDKGVNASLDCSNGCSNVIMGVTASLDCSNGCYCFYLHSQRKG